MSYQDYGHHRRRYPRRLFHRSVGVLHRGRFYLVEGEEVGEGGLSFRSLEGFPASEELVVSFRIPGGDFVSLRAEVRSDRADGGRQVIGIAFKNIPFTHKRQIRSFVSERSAQNERIT